MKVLSFILVVLGVFWAQKAKNFEAWLERIEDRCDKASNKLQVIETRLEALQGEYKDFSRHLIQAFDNYDASRGSIEVLGNWISYLKESWMEANIRLSKDFSDEA